ncbi:MAG TPA: hypothetical protein VMV10_11140 [Pirellulales bacterium]|nr:hypothetical protein [Pirellulales bacterium]
MAAGTSVPSSPSPGPNGSRPPSSGKFVEYDRYIESQLHRTRRQVKSVDLMASLMLLAAGSMAYLLLAALADHWLVPGGMGFAGRFFCLALFLTGVAAYLVLRLAPLVLRRINPIYAAQTIEQSRPGLKNSLVNFLLLRSNDALPQRVYEAIEEQAANGLSAAQIETAVDRTPLVKLLTLLMVLVGMVAVYRIASPKNPFTSFRRVIAPWADISAPTRVAIADIQPGEAEGYHDQHLNVSALVSGLSGGEQPTLHYSTADGQLVDQPVRMTLPETGYRHTAELPADAAGLQQDLEYWITAGDAISPRYKVGVKIAPAIVVDAVEYDYPAYSELTARSVPRRGDILALEGTQVTVRATATHEIKSADIDFDCDGRRDLAMKTDGRKAYVTFTLALKKNSEQPEHASYQIRFKNLAGHENPKPIRYAIEVVPDLSPEIAFVEPSAKPTEEIQLAEGAALPLKLAAADPDFKLADLRLHATRSVEPLLDKALLAEPRGGPFEGRYNFSTRSLGLKAGDRVRFWASADDNKQPDANHVETPRYTLRIVSPDGKQDQDQLASNDANKKTSDKPQNDQANDKPNPADRPSDGDGQPGDQQQPGEKGSQDKSEKQKPRDDQPSDKQKEGQEQGDEGAEGNKSSAGKQSKRDKQNNDGQNSEGQDSGEGDSESGEGQPGESRQNGKSGKGSRESSGDGSDRQNDERLDPEQDAGKAIDQINKFFNDKKKEQRGSKKGQKSPKPDEGRKGEKSLGEPAGKDETGSQDQAKQPAGEKGEKNSAGEGQREREERPMPEGDTPGKDKSQGKDPGDEKSPGSKSPGQEKSGRKQSPENDQSGAGERGEGQPSDEKSPGKSGMKDDAQPKDDAGKQESAGAQGEEKGAERKQPQLGEKGPGEKPAGEKKPNEDDQQPGPGKGGGDGEAKRESQEKKPGEKGGKSGKSQADDRNSQEPGEAGNSGQDKSKQAGEQGAGDESKTGDEMPKAAQGDRKSQAGKNAGQSKGEGKPNDKQNADEKNPEKNAGGGDAEGQDRGEGGAGQKGGDNKGPAPSPMESNKQRDKKLSPDENSKAQNDEEYNSSSISEHQSDSKGNKSGEHSGGGGKGGGQRSQSPGKGSAGQNTDADEGGGQSEQSGKGPKSDKAGDQVKGEQPSGGKPSGEKGPGTNKQAGGSKSGGAEDQRNQDAQADDDASKQPGDAKQEQQAGGKPSPGADGGQNLEQSKNRGNGPNSQTGGGLPPTESDDAPADPTDNSEPGGDDPNLEYTRKATDLALERLKDQLQKGDPDQELLDKLKWSRKDVEQFINRWDQLRSSAQQPGRQGDAAREELDETLRSLGLRPRGSSLSGGQKRGDQRRNLIESRRTAPPAEYAEQYREFSKGISRAKK